MPEPLQIDGFQMLAQVFFQIARATSTISQHTWQDVLFVTWNLWTSRLFCVVFAVEVTRLTRHAIHINPWVNETEVGAMENGVEKKYTFSKEPDSTSSWRTLNAWTWFMTYSLKKVTGWPRTERCAWPWWVMTWRQLLWVVVLWKMSCLKQHRTFGYIWFVRGKSSRKR